MHGSLLKNFIKSWKISLETYKNFQNVQAVSTGSHQSTEMGTTFPARELWVMEIFNWLSRGQLKYFKKKPKNAVNSFRQKVPENLKNWP